MSPEGGGKTLRLNEPMTPLPYAEFRLFKKSDEELK